MSAHLRSLLAGAALAVAAAAAAGESSPFGINVHAPRGEELVRLFDEVRAAGIGWVRVDVVWAAVEPEPDRYDWSDYDAIAAAAAARGLEVLGILAYSPAWATDGPPLAGAPRDGEDFAAFCRAAAARYRGAILHWEIWNEPNQARFFAGSLDDYLERVLLPCARGLHAADPEARAGGPGLAHVASRARPWPQWLLEILSRAGHELDFLTHHAYDSSGYRAVWDKLVDRTPWGRDPRLWGVLEPSLREVLAHAGALERPLWLTETGYRSDGALGEWVQAEHYRGFLAGWLRQPPGAHWPAKLFFYELRDPREGASTWGLLDRGGRRKLSYEVYRRAIGFAAVPEETPETGRAVDKPARRAHPTRVP